MNQTEQILLQAIQGSLWKKDISFPADTDWNAVLREAEHQTVLGVVVGAAPADIREEWKSKTGAGMARFMRVLHYQAQLCELLKVNGVPLAVLKRLKL